MNKTAREFAKAMGVRFRTIKLIYVDKNGESLSTNRIRYHSGHGGKSMTQKRRSTAKTNKKWGRKGDK